jgi:hypothetical protein
MHFLFDLLRGLFNLVKMLAIPAVLYAGMIAYTAISERRERAKFDERMRVFDRGFKAGHEQAEKDAKQQGEEP